MYPGNPATNSRDAKVLDVDLLHSAMGCATEDGKDGVVGRHGWPPDRVSSPVLADPEEVTKSREGGRRGVRKRRRRSSGFVLGAIHVCWREEGTLALTAVSSCTTQTICGTVIESVHMLG